ncbi:MAG: DUF3391 domain-containing protein [gamma proteobacterium symbiont of Taylorina sp.]|nr:DUF3391 domain-containing protein [gamma proteobacterium symbiont of Taylorina sp.]
MKTEVKTKTDGLEIGMFVSKIDRPWMELPVMLEGMMISSNKDLEMFQSYCDVVHIDTSKGKTPSPMSWISDDAQLDEIQVIGEASHSFSQFYKETYKTTSSLDNEINIAQNLYQSLNNIISRSFENLRANKKLDMKLIQESVITTVESTLRNPIAFRLILELQKQDKKFYNRSLGTSVWCAQIGRQLGLEKTEIYQLAMGGMLLDIGKINLSQALLNKTEPLNKQEVNLVHSHVDEGVRILVKQDDVPHSVMRMVATHHERFDGSGYPEGLKDKDTPLFGKIAGLADCYDAMISNRPFVSNVHSPHEAISDLYSLKGKLFNDDLIEQFIQTIGVYPTGSLVELQTGEVGLVFSFNRSKRLRPTVLIVLDKEKNALSNYYQVDLSIKTQLSIKQTLPRGAYNIDIAEIIL